MYFEKKRTFWTLGQRVLSVTYIISYFFTSVVDSNMTFPQLWTLANGVEIAERVESDCILHIIELSG
jgi:hypothetical protein